MYELKLDEETFENLVLAYLKDQVLMIKRESDFLTHPEDRAYNAHLLPALLTVIKYFSIPDEYEQYTDEVFSTNDNDDSQLNFKLDNDDPHLGFYFAGEKNEG